MPRPTSLDAQTANDMEAMLQSGQSIADALLATGTATTTYRRWMTRGKKAAAAFLKATETGAIEEPAETPYRLFWTGVTRARAVGKAAMVKAMRDIALDTKHLKQFDALRFMLQAQYPKEFCPLARHELSGPAGAPIPVDGPAAIVEVVIRGGEDLGDEPPAEETDAPTGPAVPQPPPKPGT